jgi:hypothetical protein
MNYSSFLESYNSRSRGHSMNQLDSYKSNHSRSNSLMCKIPLTNISDLNVTKPRTLRAHEQNLEILKSLAQRLNIKQSFVV